MKEEKDDLEKTIESLRTAVRTQEQSADKYKEENWNLEVTLQELRAQLSDSQASTQRLEGEQKRLTRLLTITRETADQHKNDAERQQSAFEELKAKHETDVAHARKQTASLQRDKSDLQHALDSMKAEMAKATRRLPRFGSPLTPNGPSASQLATPNEADEDDIFSIATSTNRRRDASAIFPLDDPDFADMSPDPSPSKPFLSPNHPTNEIEALQQRLAHAQRQINTLKGTLQREKELRIEYKRKLDASPGFVDDDEEDDDEDNFVDEEVENVRPKVRNAARRSGGRSRRGRGRGGLSLIQRFNLASQSPSSEYADESEDARETSPPPPVPPIPIHFQDESEGPDEDEDEDENETDVQNSPSPAFDSKRTSVEGMDPMFANILRRSASASSLPMSSSPLRNSVVPRQIRGGTLPRRSRGGAAYQEARPPSLIVRPEALAAELGIGMAPTMEDTEELPETDYVEFGCQTEFDEPPPIPVVVEIPPSPPTPAPVMSEMGIQVEPEPLPIIIKSDAALQTDAEPKVLRTTIGVQHSYVEPKPILISAGVATEPEPEPIPLEIPKVIFTEVEVQTRGPLMFNMDVQTIPEPEPIPVQKVDMVVQTVEPLAPAPAIQLSEDDDVTMSYGTFSSQNTVTHRPIPLPIYDEEDDGTQTETGSYLETDMEDYQDARQSIMLTTPTESLDDYHSILTVTDNDFSDSDGDDEESIKATRLARGAGGSAMSSTYSIPLPSSSMLPPPPPATYESVGISTDPVAEPTPEPEPVVETPPPEPPKPEVKEMSIQTDEWSPPPVPVSTPPTPASVPSPTLFRVGPPSQQFQFVSGPPSTTPTTISLPNVAAPSPNLRDSIPTFIPRPRSTQPADRKLSMESTFTSAMEDLVGRARTPSNVPSLVDKSRPPMMILPPPPRQPPPPNTMLPPSFIPERRFPTTSTTSSRDVPPPRPSSPPPPELIQRATTPTFSAVLNVPGGRPFGLRPHGASMPPSQAGIRQPPSTSSFRSAANAAARAQSSPAFNLLEKERREMSTTSLNSNVQSLESQRSSISSENQLYEQPLPRMPTSPGTPDRSAQSMRPGGSTDPTVIHAITQTMIGEFLYKYTRKAIGKGHGERRHKRFFWVHPYTRTLYWSSADPGSNDVAESSAKSGMFEFHHDVRLLTLLIFYECSVY